MRSLVYALQLTFGTIREVVILGMASAAIIYYWFQRRSYDFDLEELTGMGTIQTPEQMAIGRWYRIQLIQSNSYKLKKLKVQFRGWYVHERRLRIRAWRKNKLGQWREYEFYWTSLVSLVDIHAS